MNEYQTTQTHYFLVLILNRNTWILEREIFCNIINVFALCFEQCNAFLMNRSINFHQKNLTDHKTAEYIFLNGSVKNMNKFQNKFRHTKLWDEARDKSCRGMSACLFLLLSPSDSSIKASRPLFSAWTRPHPSTGGSKTANNKPHWPNSAIYKAVDGLTTQILHWTSSKHDTVPKL